MPAGRIGEMLKSKGVGPDFDYLDKMSARLDYMHRDQPVLDFIHYKKGDQDFYFIRNTGKETVTRICSFRQTGKSPQLWNPMTGYIVPISIFNQVGKHTEVPLSLPPFGSAFVVFTNEKREAQYESMSPISAGSVLMPFEYDHDGILLSTKGALMLSKNGKNLSVNHYGKQQPITGAWDVSFAKNWGTPGKTTFPELISWTQSTNEGIRHYSGSAIYSKTFQNTITQGNDHRLYLDLGEVSKVCEVWLNSKSLGIRWTKPYQFDVTGRLKEGKNELRVEVINTWANRIIGDITSEKKYTKTNLNVRGSRELRWTETPLVPSGLLGPVVIKTVTIIN